MKITPLVRKCVRSVLWTLFFFFFSTSRLIQSESLVTCLIRQQLEKRQIYHGESNWIVIVTKCCASLIFADVRCEVTFCKMHASRESADTLTTYLMTLCMMLLSLSLLYKKMFLFFICCHYFCYTYHHRLINALVCDVVTPMCTNLLPLIHLCVYMTSSYFCHSITAVTFLLKRQVDGTTRCQRSIVPRACCITVWHVTRRIRVMSEERDEKERREDATTRDKTLPYKFKFINHPSDEMVILATYQCNFRVGEM